MRPTRQSCSSPTGELTVAPALTARRKTASGSSTINIIRPVAPPIARGTSRVVLEPAAATQERCRADGKLGHDVFALADAMQHRCAERLLVERDGCRTVVDPQLGLD